MSQLTDITVSFVDNELYVLAYSADGRPGWFSSELAHFKGGPQTQTYSWNPAVSRVLPPGNYILQFVGINWGGPSGFKGSVTIGGVVQSLAGSTSNNTGVVYQEQFKFTV